MALGTMLRAFAANSVILPCFPLVYEASCVHHFILQLHNVQVDCAHFHSLLCHRLQTGEACELGGLVPSLSRSHTSGLGMRLLIS